MADDHPDAKQPDDADRYVFPTKGSLTDRQVRRIRLSRTRTLFQCTRCRGWFPPDEVGLLLDPKSHDVRQQPQCRRCRHAARRKTDEDRPA